MRKVVIVVLLVFIGFWGKGVGKAYACNNWCPGSICAPGATNPVTNVCGTWITSCCDRAGGQIFCNAGSYACMANSWFQTCCPIGGGGGTNYYVHDGCSPHGLILKCGTPDPAQFACKNSQGGCWGNWPGPVGQPTGDECNTDHPRAPNHTECQTNCWCESACTVTSPTASTLASPANGAGSSTTTVNLWWYAPASWGTACTSPNNHYTDYVGSQVATVGTTSYAFTGVRGQSYWWTVVPNNGDAAYPGPYTWWSFTILDDQIKGTVYNDPNNTCSQATPWSGGGIVYNKFICNFKESL